MSTYSIYRYFKNGKHSKQLIKDGLTKDEVIEHCSDSESSSKGCSSPENTAITEEFGEWFDGFVEE